MHRRRKGVHNPPQPKPLVDTGITKLPGPPAAAVQHGVLATALPCVSRRRQLAPHAKQVANTRKHQSRQRNLDVAPAAVRHSADASGTAAAAAGRRRHGHANNANHKRNQQQRVRNQVAPVATRLRVPRSPRLAARPTQFGVGLGIVQPKHKVEHRDDHNHRRGALVPERSIARSPRRPRARQTVAQQQAKAEAKHDIVPNVQRRNKPLEPSLVGHRRPPPAARRRRPLLWSPTAAAGRHGRSSGKLFIARGSRGGPNRRAPDN